MKSTNILSILLFSDPPITCSSRRSLMAPALGLVNVAPVAVGRPTTSVTRGGAFRRKADQALSLGNIESAEPSSVNSAVRQRQGVWMPPSQNEEKRRGMVFSIQKPQDLLDFVIEDERLSVVKVYASWCKTCKVFDIRYRKLASQLGDNFDAAKTGNGSQMSKKGIVRFAEMQYDNPDNEEMCKLLNATKLPYILIYKGSKGKVKDFQCNPSNFQMLIDTVNELANPATLHDSSEENKPTTFERQSEMIKEPPVIGMDELASVDVDDEGDTIDSLKQRLASVQKEKVEMFEVMKAQIEHDKEWIKKLENGVETQRLILEGKDEEISKLQSTIKLKEEEMHSLTNKLTQQLDKIQKGQEKVNAYQTKMSQMTDRMCEIESNITSIELQSSTNAQAAQEIEEQLLQQIKDLEEQKRLYEHERNSLRQLFLLSIKCASGKVKSLFWRLKGK